MGKRERIILHALIGAVTGAAGAQATTGGFDIVNNGEHAMIPALVGAIVGAAVKGIHIGVEVRGKDGSTTFKHEDTE